MREMTRAMKRGDEAAWRRFHDGYYEVMRAAALARGVSEADVADVIQRTYLRVMRHVKLFDAEADFRAWVCCLLRSEVIDAGRKRQRWLAMVERLKVWTGTRTVETRLMSESPLEGVEGRELLERHYVEGWSQAELAAEAGVSVKSIESKLARLRRKARIFLEKRNLTEP